MAGEAKFLKGSTQQVFRNLRNARTSASSCGFGHKLQPKGRGQSDVGPTCKWQLKGRVFSSFFHVDNDTRNLEGKQAEDITSDCSCRVAYTSDVNP